MTEVDGELATLEGGLVDEAEVAAALADFDGVWECLATREQARIVEILVERVVYYGVGASVAMAFRETGIKSLAAELTDRKEKAA